MKTLLSLKTILAGLGLVASSIFNHSASKLGNSYPVTTISTGTILSVGSPLTIGGTASSTIDGNGGQTTLGGSVNASGTITQNGSAVFNGNQNIQSNFAISGCFGSSTLTDLGGCINYAYLLAGQSSASGTARIVVPPLPQYTPYATPIAIATNKQYADLVCSPGQILLYTGTSTAAGLTYDEGTGLENTSSHLPHVGGENCIIATATSSATTATTTAISIGTSNGESQLVLMNMGAINAGTGYQTGVNTYMFAGYNLMARGDLKSWDTAVGSNSGESIKLYAINFVDPGNSSPLNCIVLHGGGTTEFDIIGGSKDDCQGVVNGSNTNVHVTDLHDEDSNFAKYGTYDRWSIANSTSTSFIVSGGTLDEDATSTSVGGQIPEQFTSGAPINIENLTVVGTNATAPTSSAVLVALTNGATLSDKNIKNETGYLALTTSQPSSTQLAVPGTGNATSGAPSAVFGAEAGLGSSTYISFNGGRASIGYDPTTINGQQGQLSVTGGSNKSVSIFTNDPSGSGISGGTNGVFVAGAASGAVQVGNVGIDNTGPSSTIDVAGSFACRATSVTVSTTLAANCGYAWTGGSVTTDTLPLVASSSNRWYSLSNYGTANADIVASGTDLINTGVATTTEYTLTPGSTLLVQNNGTYWNSLARSPQYYTTGSISGAIGINGCDTAAVAIDTWVASSTANFESTFRADPGATALSLYSLLTSPSTVTVRVCSAVAVTPTATTVRLSVQ